MDWADDGIVLSLRRHGESAAVVHLLTREHGRHAGLAVEPGLPRPATAFRGYRLDAAPDRPEHRLQCAEHRPDVPAPSGQPAPLLW